LPREGSDKVLVFSNQSIAGFFLFVGIAADNVLMSSSVCQGVEKLGCLVRLVMKNEGLASAPASTTKKEVFVSPGSLLPSTFEVGRSVNLSKSEVIYPSQSQKSLNVDNPFSALCMHIDVHGLLTLS
jgi:hypothetical protein